MAMTGAEALDRFQQLGRQPWVAAVQKRGPGIAALLLAALVAWQLAGLVWSLLPTREDADISPPVAVAASSGPDTNAPAAGTDVGSIVAAHIFGVARQEDEQAVAAQQPEEVEKIYTGPLELRGTLASDSRDHALAIIADGRDEDLFAIGDTVQNGITLHAVQREQVILSRSGVLEALRLPRPEASTGAAAPTPRARPSIRRAQTPTMSQVLTQNAAQFTQIISPRPYYVSGQQKGYRLYPGSDRRSFAKLGLRPGDIVTSINGTPLNNPSQGARVFSELGAATSVTVTLERGGQEQTLTLDTSSLDFSNQASQ